MDLGEKEFLQKYNINFEEYEKTGLKWQDLMNIHNDFSKKKEDYEELGNDLLRIINKFSGVSSSRFRVKDSEHLIAKIIRKKIEKKEKFFTLDNYEQEIQDLIGFRVIHIFKEEWNEIDKEIRRRWNVEICEYNQRKGDNLLKNTGLDYAKMEIKEHKRGYRSIHYIIKTKEIKHRNKFIEIQVRTIFEEAWSEMDHKVIYPYYLNNKVLNNYSLILNRVAGMADEMGNFMKNEVVSLSELDRLDDENKKLKDENEILKAKIREYENNLIDVNKNIKQILKENQELNEVYNPITEFEKQQEIFEELRNPVAEFKKSQEMFKELRNPIAELRKSQEIFKELRNPVVEFKKSQEMFKELRNPIAELRKSQEIFKELRNPVAEFKKSQEMFKELRNPIAELRKSQEILKELQNSFKKFKK